MKINGQEYEHREQKTSKASKRMNALLAMGMTLDPSIGGLFDHRKLPNNISIENEFELIQQKKSRLSKRDRDIVEYTFHSRYQLKTTTTP